MKNILLFWVAKGQFFIRENFQFGRRNKCPLLMVGVEGVFVDKGMEKVFFCFWDLGNFNSWETF